MKQIPASMMHQVPESRKIDFSIGENDADYPIGRMQEAMGKAIRWNNLPHNMKDFPVRIVDENRLAEQDADYPRLLIHGDK